MRDRTVSFPREVGGLRLGPDPGDCHHGQTAETNKRRLRKLRNQVGLDLNFLGRIQMYITI